MEIQVNSGEVDEDGNPIFYTYSDGKFWHNGNEVKRNSGLKKIFNGEYSGFLGKVYTALQMLEKSSQGKIIIDHLVSDEEIYKIIETNSGSWFDPNNKNVHWNVSDGFNAMGDYGVISAPAFINLGHDLAHAFLSTGKNDYTFWFTKSDTRKPVSRDEIVATQLENKIRMDYNLPRRAWYHFYKNNLGTYIKEGEIPK